MSLINENIDQIILDKAYHELSYQELMLVAEFIEDELEYNDTRAMLQSVYNELSNIDELEPKEETEAYLTSLYKKTHPALNSRTSGLGFLFPDGKAFYQKPGYQLLAIAAVLVLVFTLFFDFNKPFEQEQNKVAINEQNEHQNQAEDSNVLSNADEENKVKTEDANITDNSNMEGNINISEKESQELATTNSFQTDLKVYKSVPSEQPVKIAEETEFDMLEKSDKSEATAEKDYATTIISGSSEAGGANTPQDDMDIAMDDGYAFSSSDEMADGVPAPPVAEAEEIALNETENTSVLDEIVTAEKSTNVRTLSAKKEKDSAPVVTKSQSLAQNSALIKVFYTAM